MNDIVRYAVNELIRLKKYKKYKKVVIIDGIKPVPPVVLDINSDEKHLGF